MPLRSPGACNVPQDQLGTRLFSCEVGQPPGSSCSSTFVVRWGIEEEESDGSRAEIFFRGAASRDLQSRQKLALALGGARSVGRGRRALAVGGRSGAVKFLSTLRVALADRPALPRLRIDACRPRLVARQSDGRALFQCAVGDRNAGGSNCGGLAQPPGRPLELPGDFRPGNFGRAIAVHAGAQYPRLSLPGFSASSSGGDRRARDCRRDSPIHSAAEC